MNKYLTGAILALLVVIAAAFVFGVFEEANDGPLENAAEAVKDVVE